MQELKLLNSQSTIYLRCIKSLVLYVEVYWLLMASLDFNRAESIASSDSACDSDIDSTPERVGIIHKSDHVVLQGRPVKVVDVSHSKPGKHGHAKASRSPRFLLYHWFDRV